MRKKRMGRKYIYDLMDKDQVKSRIKEKAEINKRHKRQFKKEEAIYGFNASQTWNMEYTMAEILYERLCMYREKASSIIDMEVYEVEVDGVTYTVKEAVDRMISLGAFYLTPEPDVDEKDLEKWESNRDHMYDKEVLKERERDDAAHLMWRIWAEVYPHMWW